MLRRHGIEPDASLEVPECPGALAYLMTWYEELRAFGRQAMAGVHPLVWADVGEWARAMRVRPSPQDYRILMQLDFRFRDAAAKNKPADKPKRPSPAPHR